jgi:hypothetical protein
VQEGFDQGGVARESTSSLPAATPAPLQTADCLKPSCCFQGTSRARQQALSVEQPGVQQPRWRRWRPGCQG